MVKNLPANAREGGLISTVRKIPPEKEMTTHSKYSSLENSMNRGAWQATEHGVTKESDTT